MRLALLSDIHANVRALDACLDHAREQGVEGYAVLGDIVGYGAEPGEVVDRIAALAEAGATVIKGNHDDLACAPPPIGQAKSIDEAAATWSFNHLSDAQRAFLKRLPMTAQIGKWLLVHASADRPECAHNGVGRPQGKRSNGIPAAHPRLPRFRTDHAEYSARFASAACAGDHRRQRLRAGAPRSTATLPGVAGER